MGEKDATDSDSGRLRKQEAIMSSELFWYGRLMDSDDIHTSLDQPKGPDHLIYDRTEEGGQASFHEDPETTES